MSFSVERKPDVFEFVRADTFKIENDWLLFFKRLPAFNSEFVIGFPAREVVSFFPDDEG